MDRCTKFKMFNLLLVFCVVNFFIYRIITGSSVITDISKIRFAANSTTRRVDPSSPPVSLPAKLPPSNNTQKQSPSSLPSPTSGSAAVVTATNTENKGKEATGPDPVVEDKPKDSTPVLSSPSDSKPQKDLPQCPLVPPALNGGLATYLNAPSFEEIAKECPGLKPGGLYKPPDCQSRHRVAIVIPYRNREEHLKTLLHNLHPMLQRQQLDYGIYVVDQALPGRFNRAMLMNIGYKEAMSRYDYQCAIFHDVDLIPENDRNIYSCPEQPRHLSAAIDKFKYRLPYANIFGGASAVNKKDFENINGFSNLYFGWGGEDDDMATRIGNRGLKITRYPMEIARYRMIKHTKEKNNEQNPQRFALLRSAKQRQAKDGLNSLVYEVKKVDLLPTHTRIEVFIDEAKVTKS